MRPCGKIVSDEQLIDNELHFVGVRIDMAAPPALEFEITRSLGVDLRVEIVLLRPEGIGRVQALEILHQPGAVELAGTHVAGECCEPASAEQPTRIAHGATAL